VVAPAPEPGANPAPAQNLKKQKNKTMIDYNKIQALPVEKRNALMRGLASMELRGLRLDRDAATNPEKPWLPIIEPGQRDVYLRHGKRAFERMSDPNAQLLAFVNDLNRFFQGYHDKHEQDPMPIIEDALKTLCGELCCEC
jgi:hypothetical protein